MTVNSNRFDNEGFIVLGNATEIGRGIAVAAVRQGARVVLGLPGEEPATAVDGGEGISVVTSKMCSESGIRHVFDESLERLADLAVLIHCLSVPELSGQSLAKTLRNEWDQMMSVCLREPFLSSQCAIQEFLAAGAGGRIVFALSLAADRTKSQVGCAVVQPALYAFIRSIAKEYGRRGIICNAVAIHHENDPQYESNASRDAVTETVLFLASDEASFVNGEMIPVSDSAPHSVSIRQGG